MNVNNSNSFSVTMVKILLNILLRQGHQRQMYQQFSVRDHAYFIRKDIFMDKLVLCSFSKTKAQFIDEFIPLCSYTVKHGHHDTSILQFLVRVRVSFILPPKTRTEINLSFLVSITYLNKCQIKRQDSFHTTRTKTKSIEIMNVNITTTAFL